MVRYFCRKKLITIRIHNIWAEKSRKIESLIHGLYQYVYDYPSVDISISLLNSSLIFFFSLCFLNFFILYLLFISRFTHFWSPAFFLVTRIFFPGHPHFFSGYPHFFSGHLHFFLVTRIFFWLPAFFLVSRIFTGFSLTLLCTFCTFHFAYFDIALDSDKWLVSFKFFPCLFSHYLCHQTNKNTSSFFFFFAYLLSHISWYGTMINWHEKIALLCSPKCNQDPCPLYLHPTQTTSANTECSYSPSWNSLSLVFFNFVLI